MELSIHNAKEENGKTVVNHELTFSKKVSKYFKEYCDNCTFHGFKYLSERRTTTERIWWLVSMIISMGICLYLIIQTYNKWDTSPVIVSFATTETPIWKIPFPAVTVCPLTKSVPSKFNFTKYIIAKTNDEILSPEESRKMGYLSLVCNFDENWIDRSALNYTDADLFQFLEEVQPDFNTTFTDCSLFGDFVNCSELFFPIITDEGLCYTFNLLDRSQVFRDNVALYGNFHNARNYSNWTLEHGYSLHDGIRTYPRRALFAGAPFALQFILNTYEDELDYACRDGILGYRMQLSNPAVMPRTQQQHLLVPHGRSVECAIDLNLVQTSEAVKKYSPKVRNCYYPTERSLKYFKLYSQENCQIECKTDFYIRECNCVDFYMPRDHNTTICSEEKFMCLTYAQNKLLYENIEKKIAAEKGTQMKTNVLDCDCLPLCTSMRYSVETTQTQWEWTKIVGIKTPERMQRKSFIQIYMKTNQYMSSERNELFGVTDFLSNIGGLFGLFIGFSLLSLTEIIYYLSLRMIKNVQLFGDWSGP